MKQTQLRPRSKKRAKLMREVSQDRLDFVAEFGRCCVCGSIEDLHVHEIASGPAREAALSERCAWLPACDYCNGEVLTDHSKWSIEKQLARKALIDPEHYDRRRVNELRGRAPEAISEIDVIKAAWNR